jgi:hypothetical protein
LLERLAQRLAVQSIGLEPAQRDDALEGVVHLERETTGLERHVVSCELGLRRSLALP